MNLRQRSYDLELLDQPGIPFRDIEQNMQELEFINSKLGGHSITLAGIKQIINQEKRGNQMLHVLEMGCGGGDNLWTIHQWARKRGVALRFTGVDLNPECIAYAKKRLQGMPVELICSDYRELKPEQPFDIVFNALFCHHFTDEQLCEMMGWMRANSRLGFFINDLQRHQLAYHSIKWLTKWFSRSHLVKNDAPLSVLRGFHRSDWQGIMNKAALGHYKLQWKWAFRWLLVYQHQTNGHG